MNTFFQTERLFRLTDITSANEVKLLSLHALRYWQKRTRCCGHIVAHDVSWETRTRCCGHIVALLRTQNVSEQSQKRFLSSGHKICVRNKCCEPGQTGKHLCRQQCNNVSATMCPRLPRPLVFPVKLLSLL